MRKRIDLDVDLSYSDLDTVIAGLERLRELHGGKSIVEIEMEPIPYDDENREEIGYYLIPEQVPNV